jgi:ABC-type phosphate/phosphonate transport system substrate-binding protein
MTIQQIGKSLCVPSSGFTVSFPYAHRLWIGLALGMALLPLTATDARATVPDVVRVGMVKSLFRDMPEPVVKALLIPFGSLMAAQTGMNGKILVSDNALTLGDQLEKGQMDLGMFQGFEYAWAQERHPDLKPLMLAVDHNPYMTVHLVTRDGSGITSFEDLRGKTVSLPCQSRGHCCLFLSRYCEKFGSTPKQFFSKVVKHGNAEVGLDDVVRGAVDAAIVDSVTLDCYTTVKPGCTPLLKTLEKSEPFPAAVVVYKDGTWSKENLNLLRKGMLNAAHNPKSRGLMTLWSLTAFAPIPSDLQPALDNIRKAYPAPATP